MDKATEITIVIKLNGTEVSRSKVKVRDGDVITVDQPVRLEFEGKAKVES